MTETQKRIKAYQKALPGMKERVSAVALLLVVSISMMTSATFAWVTLSRAPEVNGMATTIATNGNLEIALSDTDGLEPDETAVGDGGKPVTESNLTWGNLINLSDASYGLDQLTLRPAILNSGSLLDSPLYSVEYGSDGRITELVSDFAFTNYDTIDGASAFFVPDETEYGVRAISSVTYSSVTGDAMLVGLSNDVARNQGYAIQSFQALYGNKGYMSSITGLAGVYLQYRKDDVDQDCTDYVEVLYKMMDEYEDTLLLVGDTLLSMANLHHFVYCNQKNQTYTAFNLTDLNTGAVKTTLAAEGVTLSAMDMYLSNYKTFFGTANNNYTDGLWPRYQENIYNVWARGGYIGWETLSSYINLFADLYSAEVNGEPAGTLGASAMASIALASSKVCVLKSGLIKDMDKMLGTELSIKNVPMSALSFNIIITEIKTDAESPYFIQEDVKAANRKAASGGLAATDAVAADTYGMAIDFWVRTNAPDSLLMLEGELEYQTITLTDGDGNVLTDDKGNPITEMKVVGYSGANRIWEENDPNLPILGTSVTQGSGSCYIFYPETPEDQAQALEMLRAMCVAFVGLDEAGEGTLLAQADMDVDNAIEDGGRVLVPLQLRAKSVEVEDEDGNLVTGNSYHIVELEQNVATKITAIVYMDGSRLSNSQVLSSSSIQGQLNIQFGTTEDMVAMDNPELKEDYYNIMIAVADEELTYDPNNLPSTTVTLILNGMEANSIQANYVSYISETQGARQPAFTFTNTPGTNEWVGEVTFNGPGSYHLRSVQIDGVDYALTQEQVESTVVYIPGVGVSGVTCIGWDGNTDSYMTADSYYTLEMKMDLSIGQGISNPRSVQGVFAHEDGQNVAVSFTQTNNGWVAKTNFTTSGTYTMTYAIIDGTYVPLAPAQYKTLTLNLGMQARVFLTQPVTQEYLDDLEELNEAEEAAIAAVTGTDAEKEAAIADIKADYDARRSELLAELNGEDGLKMTTSNSGYQFEYDGSEPLFMDVGVLVTDDKGNVMTNLSGVKLHYGIGASMVNRLDADLTFNSANNRYEGAQFQLTKPGTYTFQSLETDTGAITSASGAPKVAAIAKDPIYYVGKNDDSYKNEYVTNYKNIGADNTNPFNPRPISIVLGDAPSAAVVLTMENLDLPEGDENRVRILDAEIISSDEEAGLYEYSPYYTSSGVKRYGAPTDGTWKITGMKVANAYYGGVYYDGAEGEGATGWLDLSEQVLADNIVTEFFTVINFSCNKQPDGTYSGPFMTDHEVKGMTITLTDYLGNAIPGTEVNLTYTWNSATNNVFTVAAGTKLPNTQFGGDKLSSTNGKDFVVGDLNFQLDGQYNVKFSIVVDGETYENISSFAVPADGGFNARDVEVSWDNDLPNLTITGVSNATTNEAGQVTYTKFSVDIDTADNNESWTELAGVTNYYENTTAGSYANVYIAATGAHEFTLPSVTMRLNKIGEAESASFGLAKNDNRTYNFTSEGEEASCDMGVLTPGSTLSWRRYRSYVGEQTIERINMVDENGITYSVELLKPVKVNQQAIPVYLQLNVDTTKVDMPATISATAYNGSSFTVSTGGSGTVYVISPDGRAIDVVLPSASGQTTGVTEYGSSGTESEYTVDPDTATSKVYVQTEWKVAFWGTNKYSNYTRTTFYTTTVAEKYDVQYDYVVSKWTVNGTDKNAGDTVYNIATTTTATATVSETRTVNSTTNVVRYKYYIKDVLDASGQTSTNGGTDVTLGTQYSDYTYLGEDTDKTVEVVAD